MANQEHLDKLKEGVATWNQWRTEHRDISPDLREANLREADLNEANLSGADFIRTDLREANLSGADLSGADLSGAKLLGAHLSEANLTRADLSGAHLSGANLSGANLCEADLSTATCWNTVFANIDLQTVKGLQIIKHDGPSTIGIDTIYHSQGNIPEIFLKGAGIDDRFIENIRSLTHNLFEYYSCFISYSSKDQAFAERIYADLQSKNVRCWFAPHHMRIGDKIRPRIDESIRIYDKLLLVLSEESVLSHWVEHEVETALDKEREGKSNVLFPIRIDETIMTKKIGWANHVRNTRHIGDFTHWETHQEYQKAFTRLLDDLKAQSS